MSSCADRLEGAECSALCESNFAATGNPTFKCVNRKWVGGCRFGCTNWVVSGKSTYMAASAMGAGVATWAEAEQFCRTKNSYLAVLVFWVDL
jgi:hypothetical protein